ncbi:MAG: tetratricopeptide repeat protein [Acidobacteriota bacterium]|nr:tetratricopeptide repeat protein [Acidobacteriota bacterium]
MSQDPYASYLRQADDLFTRGDIVKAGQIWQAILKREPGHTLARERLLLVKQRLEVLAAREAPRQPPAPAPVPVPPAPVSNPGAESLPWAEPEPVPESSPAPAPSAARLEPDRLVIEGCTLYDMGQVEDALRKWTQVLTLDPTHRLAREYANGARRDLGLPPLDAVAVEPWPAAPPAASPQAAGSRPGAEDLDKLLHEAVQLYDIGLLEDAVSKWERVLALDPDRTEVRAYLDQTRAELGRRTPAAPLPPPRPAGPDPGLLDLKLRQAEHLLNLQRPEEAAFTFQQALGLDPGNPRALQGLERCRRATLPTPPVASAPPEPVGRILMVEPDAEPVAGPQAVTPPAALVRPATGLRSGLTLPRLAEGSLARLPWLRDPKILATGAGGLIVIILGLGAFHSYRKDQALREAVKAARAAAIAPISREAQAVDLTETPADIRKEAEAALDTDPLRAYLRAATLAQRNPGDAQAAELLEKAKAALPGGAVGATLDEYQKHLQAGDLDAAAQVMDALLRANPDDADLRRRAARLELALCSIHAARSRWDDAALDLERGRALFPDDKSWQARLKLLGQIRAMPKDQRGDWIGLLG